MKQWLALSFMLLMATHMACKKDQTDASGSLSLTFMPVVGQDRTFSYDDPSYQNPAGQTYTISAFKYYLSNFVLTNSQTKARYAIPGSYFLIEKGRTFSLTGIPTGTYDQLEFAIGIDASANKSLAKTGELDPNNDMAWDWNTGYKFIKLEGRFGSKGLVFHIGGDQAYRSLVFKDASGKNINIRENAEASMGFEVDVNGLFSSPNPVDFNVLNESMGGPSALKIADNAAQGMFRLVSIN